MTPQKILEEKYRHGQVSANDLAFGRKMPFGRYKGQFVYYLLVKHWRYMDELVRNLGFQLTETELWWKNKLIS